MSVLIISFGSVNIVKYANNRLGNMLITVRRTMRFHFGSDGLLYHCFRFGKQLT